MLSVDVLELILADRLLLVSDGVRRKTASESHFEISLARVCCKAWKKFHGTLIHKFQCLRSIGGYCSRSQPGTPPSHAHVCSPVFPLPPAHVRSSKESGKYFAGFTRDGGDFTGKPRPIVFPLAPSYRSTGYLFLARVDREVRIISPFAEATMCGTCRTFIYETGVAVKSQIATQICRADNNGVYCRARKKRLRTLVGTRRRKGGRAVGTSRGLALTTRL